MSRTGNYKAGWIDKVKSVSWCISGNSVSIEDEMEVFKTEMSDEIRKAYHILLERNGLDPLTHEPVVTVDGDTVTVNVRPKMLVKFED